jgi:CMP-N,N'-diacetyllegionaminic acid synthase
MEVLGIIPARGGSKSIPLKSIYPCAGKPLMAYTVDAAKDSKLITRLIVSTDSEEIASVARGYSVEVPFMRPAELAGDLTPDLPVFVHALRNLEEIEGYKPDVVVHLRPTTPLKTAEDIDRGVELLIADSGADSVRSVCEPIHTPFKMYRIREGETYLEPLLLAAYPEVFGENPEAFNMPRQALPDVLRHSGYIDVIRTRTILELKSMSGLKMLPLPFEKWRDVDIDSMEDLMMAEILINKERNTNA